MKTRMSSNRRICVCPWRKITAPPVPGPAASYIFGLKSGRSWSLRHICFFFFFPFSLIDVDHKQGAAADACSPPLPWVRWRMSRTSHSQWLQACKGQRLQHTNDWIDASGAGSSSKENRSCIFAIGWQAWQDCSSLMHLSDHWMVGQDTHHVNPTMVQSWKVCLRPCSWSTELSWPQTRGWKTENIIRYCRLGMNCSHNRGLLLLKDMAVGEIQDCHALMVANESVLVEKITGS